jgi:hypothetical protein
MKFILSTVNIVFFLCHFQVKKEIKILEIGTLYSVNNVPILDGFKYRCDIKDEDICTLTFKCPLVNFNIVGYIINVIISSKFTAFIFYTVISIMTRIIQ